MEKIITLLVNGTAFFTIGLFIFWAVDEFIDGKNLRARLTHARKRGGK